MIFDRMPYTNFHELNLDWILVKMKELTADIEHFTELNTVKYHDPIAWNITTQYEQNVIVKDPNTGILYISKKPVPQGISLNNTDYWIEIGDMSYDIAFLKDAICTVDEGTSLTATQNYNQRDLLWWMDKFYMATASINQGDAFGANNLMEVNVASLFASLYNDLQTQISNFNDFVDGATPASLYAGSTIHIFGDSNTVPAYLAEENRWYATVANTLGCTYINHGVSNTCWQTDVSDGGGGYRGNFRSQINAQTADSSVKLVMICGGINDYHYGTYDISAFSKFSSVVCISKTGIDIQKKIIIPGTQYWINTGLYQPSAVIESCTCRACLCIICALAVCCRISVHAVTIQCCQDPSG